MTSLHEGVSRAMLVAAALEQPLTEEELSKSMDTLIAKFNDSQTATAIRSETDELANNGITMAQGFGSVAALLTSTIADSSTSWDLKFKLGPYLKEWIERCVQFARLILLSGTVAGDALTAANEFVNNIVPALLDDTKDRAAKKSLIEGYIAKLAANEARAQSLSQGFGDLQKALESFVQRFADFLKSYNISDMEKRVQELSKQIKDLYDILNGLTKQVADLTQALKASKTAMRATGIFGFLCPVLWIGTAVAAGVAAQQEAALREVQRQQQQTSSDIRTKESERDRLQKDIQSIPALRTAFNRTIPDVAVVVARIGSLATMWATIRADTQAIEEKLDYANGTSSDPLFKKRVNTAAAMYGALGTAISAYKQYIDTSQEWIEQLKKWGINL